MYATVGQWMEGSPEFAAIVRSGLFTETAFKGTDALVTFT